MTTASHPRIQYRKLTAANSAMFALHDAIAGGPLEGPLLDLVRIRASQLNGCAFCLDMHVRDARTSGESEQRLDVLASWREAPLLFSDRERAALAFAEAVTTLSDGGVPDAVIEAAETCFDREELATLLFAVAEINAWNRLAVTARTPVPRRGS